MLLYKLCGFFSGGVMYQYFIKIVPTVYHMLNGEVRQVFSNFSVTSTC